MQARQKAYSPLVWGGVLAIVGIVSIVAILVWNARSAATAAGERSATNLIELINADILRNIELHDAPIQGVLHLEKTRAFADLPPETLHALKFGRLSTARALGAMLVLDAQGNVTADSTSVAPRVENFSDRNYFRHHLETADDHLRVGYLLAPRFDDGKPRLILSRRISDAQGRFQGVVVSGMRLAYFDRLLKGLHMDVQSTVSLLHTDGTLLARRGNQGEEDRVGQNFSRLPNFEQALSKTSGTFHGTSALDGIPREYVFSRVGEHPLLVVVGLSLPEVYQAWSRATAVICTATGALCLAILAWLWRINRELTERRSKLRRANQLARTDGLTQLPNRRHFEERLLTASPELPWSVLLIDADHFKSINDRFGHPFGDKVLQALAEVVRQALTESSYFGARYGGEEFVMILPATSAEQASRVATDIRLAVQALQLLPGDERLSVSIGLACARRPGEGRETLVARADRALYRAKEAGRNRVWIAD